MPIYSVQYNCTLCDNQVNDRMVCKEAKGRLLRGLSLLFFWLNPSFFFVLFWRLFLGILEDNDGLLRCIFVIRWAQLHKLHMDSSNNAKVFMDLSKTALVIHTSLKIKSYSYSSHSFYDLMYCWWEEGAVNFVLGLFVFLVLFLWKAPVWLKGSGNHANRLLLL